jgi:hypothetical protein
MEQNPKMPNQPSMQEMLRMAASPAGKQLIALMQQKGGEDLQKAMKLAATGDYTQAKKTMESVLSDPQAQKLLKELGGLSVGRDGR